MTDDSTEPNSDARDGFGTAEKVVGAAAGYKHPFVSGVVAGEMLQSETNPTRRRQLMAFRRATLAWWGAGVLAGLIGLVVVISVASSHGLGGTSCRGGRDRFAAEDVTYQSNDDKHWTATYPCQRGGSTTVPVPRRKVPGGGR